MDNYLNSLLSISSQTYEIGQKISDNLKPNLSNDNHFMCKSFCERQLSQMESLIKLYSCDDVILIARSMFEGALYLFYSMKYDDMCYRWRMFAILIDKQRMDKCIANNENVPKEVELFINQNITEIDRLFKKSNGKYHNKWYGQKTIREIAESSDEEFLRLYDKYYSKMSEYHHWGAASFGKRNTINANILEKTNSDEVKLERANAITMAISSLYSSLKISSLILKADANNKLLMELESMLKNIKNTTTTEMHITKQSSQ